MAILDPFAGLPSVPPAQVIHPPYNAICSITDGETPCGTGFLVRPTVVLTARHVLVDAGVLSAAERPAADLSIRFSGRDTIIHPIDAADFVANPADHRPDNDLALLILGQTVNVAPLHCLATSDPKLDQLKAAAGEAARLVSVPGYPGLAFTGLRSHSGRLAAFTDTLVDYAVNTESGHSGSPVIARLNGQTVVIGVHVLEPSDDMTTLANRGVRYTHAAQNWISNHA